MVDLILVNVYSFEKVCQYRNGSCKLPKLAITKLLANIVRSTLIVTCVYLLATVDERVRRGPARMNPWRDYVANPGFR